MAFLLLREHYELSVLPIISKQFRVFTFFFVGAMINVHFVKFKDYKWIVIAIATGLLLLSTKNGYLGDVLRPFTDSVFVLWFSMIGSWGWWLSKYNSVSYDIYLFHFPVIQVLVTLGVVSSVGGWCALGLTVVISVIMAVVSWLCIGKKILNYKLVKN